MLLLQTYARHAMVQTSTMAVGAAMVVVETAAAAAMHFDASTAVMTVATVAPGAGTGAGTGIEVARTTAETAAAGATALGTRAKAGAEALTVADDGPQSAQLLLMYVGGVEILRNLPLFGGGSVSTLTRDLENGRYVLTGQSTGGQSTVMVLG